MKDIYFAALGIPSWPKKQYCSCISANWWFLDGFVLRFQFFKGLIFSYVVDSDVERAENFIDEQ